MPTEAKSPPQPPPAGASELLSTKFAMPQPRSPLVPREALLARLDEGVQGAYRLTLVSAPAGFGKTILVSQWIARRMDAARESRRMNSEAGGIQPSARPSAARLHPSDVAWVSLDAGDNDPVRFWRYVFSACQAFGIETESALAHLRASQEPVFEAALTTLINALARVERRVLLVLEDYHCITAGRIHETMAFLLEHLPAALHVVLLTRSDPPLPLARLRAHHQLKELRAADLRFSVAETQAFLEQALPFPLAPETVGRLAERTEGWPAGLRLVALALQGLDTPEALEGFVDTFSGGHRPILEYLAAEVLAGQPAPVRAFLLQTSGLSRLSGPLCDAVTGRMNTAREGRSATMNIEEPDVIHQSSPLILQYLERANLFVVPLDSAGQWYRYHALFAEAMQQQARLRLGDAHLRELSHRASQWYEQHGLLAEAVEAGLAAQEPEHVAQLIDRIVGPRPASSELQTLRRWMEQLPLEVLRPYPHLCLTYATAILFTSDRAAPETHARLQAPLEAAEQAWRASGDEPMLGQALAFRALAAWLQGRLSQAFAVARQALELLPEDNVQARGVTLLLVGGEELFAGRLNAAHRALSQAHALCVAASNIYATLDSLLLLGQVCAGRGELHQAAALFRQVLAEIEHAPMEWGLARARWAQARAGLAALDMERNELDSAAQQAAQAFEVGQQHLWVADEELRVHSALILAGVQQARGRLGDAQQRLQALGAETGQPSLLREVRAAQARLALTHGDLAAVQRWSATLSEPGSAVSRLQQEQEAFITIRLLIARGEAPAALRSIEAWRPEAQAQGRGRSELELQILAALAHAAQGDPAQAHQALRQALALAHPEGFQRLFLDEASALAGLLRTLIPEIEDKAVAAYARALLYGMAQARPELHVAAPAGSELLAEPLSPQEERVLRLLAAGLSKPEIAQELVVSVNTVKTHVRRIYAKLNVRNRREAREAARHLKLG